MIINERKEKKGQSEKETQGGKEEGSGLTNELTGMFFPLSKRI